MYQRSTKGASKQRRDLINVEINEIKDLLPVNESIRKRLSQLQVMALCNSYIAKSICFQNSVNNAELDEFTEYTQHFGFTEALPGFLFTITLEGKLLYISENVTEYLGHSVVELMTQADTIYDVIDRREHHVMREFLQSSKVMRCDNVKVSSQDELDLVCHMNLGQLFRRNNVFDRKKVMKIHGHVIWPEGSLTLTEPIFVGRVTPVLGSLPNEQMCSVPDTMMFCSSHSLDLKFIHVEHNGEFHLGYKSEELLSKSWYHLVHPDYIAQITSKHLELIQKGLDTAKSLVVKVQTKYGNFVWMHVLMRFATLPLASLGGDNLPQEIVCLNHVMDEKQALDTMNHINMEERFSTNDFRYAFNSNIVSEREAYVPTVVVEEELLDHMMNEDKPVNCNHEELMQRIRQKAQGKVSKARPSDFNASEYMKQDTHDYNLNQGYQAQYVANRTSVHFGGKEAKERKSFKKVCRAVVGSISPPLSEDGSNSADCASLTYTAPTPEFTMYTPPYSPSGGSFVDESMAMTSQQDDMSFFDGVFPGNKQQSFSVKRKREESVSDDLPELDHCLVEHILQGVECFNPSNLNFHQNFLNISLPSQFSQSIVNSGAFPAATFQSVSVNQKVPSFQAQSNRKLATLQPVLANQKLMRPGTGTMRSFLLQNNVYDSTAGSLADFGPLYGEEDGPMDLMHIENHFDSFELASLG